MKKKQRKWVAKAGSSFAKSTYSKKLATLVTIFFFGTCVVYAIAYAKGIKLSELLITVADTFKLVLITYAGKSGVENVIKINKTQKLAQVANDLGVAIEETKGEI